MLLTSGGVDSSLLKMRSLTSTTTPNARHHYITVGEFLEHGPDIYMDHSEVQNSIWSNYELEVEEFLRDKGTTFLNRPLDRHWMEKPYQEANDSLYSWTTISVGFKNKVDLLISLSLGLMIGLSMEILFWIGHITAALGFVLAANTPGSDGSPTAGL